MFIHYYFLHGQSYPGPQSMAIPKNYEILYYGQAAIIIKGKGNKNTSKHALDMSGCYVICEKTKRNTYYLVGRKVEEERLLADDSPVYVLFLKLFQLAPHDGIFRIRPVRVRLQ